MSDWNDDQPSRRKPGPFESEMDSFDDDEFGGPLFGATTEQPAVGFDDDLVAEPLRFDADESGSLPHWTSPPTGEIPRIEAAERTSDPTDDVDVWSSFAGAAGGADDAVEAPKDPTGELMWHDDPTVDDAPAVPAGRPSGSVPVTETVEPARREPARITIGTDPSGMPRRPDPKRRGARSLINLKLVADEQRTNAFGIDTGRRGNPLCLCERGQRDWHAVTIRSRLRERPA